LADTDDCYRCHDNIAAGALVSMATAAAADTQVNSYYSAKIGVRLMSTIKKLFSCFYEKLKFCSAKPNSFTFIMIH